MLLVVPSEETVAEAARILQRAKAVGKFRTVFERLELTFRERIVVGDVRPAREVSKAESYKLRKVRNAVHAIVDRCFSDWSNVVRGSNRGDCSVAETAIA